MASDPEPSNAESSGGPIGFRLARLAADDPRLGPLIGELDAYLASLYPSESNHLQSVEALSGKGALLIGVVGEDDALLGCGAVLAMSDDGLYGEVKRVYVRPRYRGRGLSKAIMRHLEMHLLDAGLRVARLETGVHQHEALALYRRLGYRCRPPFGAYREDPLSVFMEKRLLPSRGDVGPRPPLR